MSLEITAQVIKFFLKKKKKEIAFKVPFWGKGGIFLRMCRAGTISRYTFSRLTEIRVPIMPEMRFQKKKIKINK